MKHLLLIILLIETFYGVAVAQESSKPTSQDNNEVTYSELRKLVDDGLVASASVTGDGWWVSVTATDGVRYYAQVTPQTPISDHLYEAGVPVKIVHWSEEDDESPAWLSMLFNVLPLLIFIVFFVLVLWFSQKRGKKVQDDCLKRAEAINNEFLDRQQVQFNKFIEDFASVAKGKVDE
jgi:ATP-dependent Zn protease